ncbi:hypothetical protein MTR67_035281 [Solanum verrucosum]|uniref:Uncharacterized protein n=1 Tax=Solanum verrucosum TaxID=315347 RepID=A0AAF0ZJP7_SOLVR|nr:hypothetical protein MTR67_035281 [Solanum verrucosum]
MGKMMTQHHFSSNHVIGGGIKLVNAIVPNIAQYPNDVKFEVLHNEEDQYLGNQMGGSHPNY